MRRRRKEKARYVLRSVTGFSEGERKPRTLWYVLDSANCYRPMHVQGLTYGKRGEQLCRERARQLNALHKAYLENLV